LGKLLELSSTPFVGATSIWIIDKLIMGFLILIEENLRTGGTRTHDKGKNYWMQNFDCKNLMEINASRILKYRLKWPLISRNFMGVN
jgi:hypothetical protein